MRPYQLL